LLNFYISKDSHWQIDNDNIQEMSLSLLSVRVISFKNSAIRSFCMEMILAMKWSWLIAIFSFSAIWIKRALKLFLLPWTTPTTRQTEFYMSIQFATTGLERFFLSFYRRMLIIRWARRIRAEGCSNSLRSSVSLLTVTMLSMFVVIRWSLSRILRASLMRILVMPWYFYTPLANSLRLASNKSYASQKHLILCWLI